MIISVIMNFMFHIMRIIMFMFLKLYFFVTVIFTENFLIVAMS